MSKRSSGENSNDTEKDQTLPEESQKKEKLPEGSSWMEDPEFYKMLLKRRADSKGKKKDIKDVWG